MRRNLKGLGLTLAITTLLTGCGSTTATTSSANSSSTANKTTTAKPNTIVMALGPLATINWYLPIRPIQYNSALDGTAAGLMFKGLLHIGSTGKIQFSRSIAKSVHWNAQGTVYTVTLHKKWHWSNGTPVTAQDVLFTWHIIKAASSKTAPAPWPFAGVNAGGVPQLIQSVTAKGSHQFVVTLKKPANQIWFEYNGLTDFLPLPAKAWDKYPTNMKKELTYLGKNGGNPKFLTLVDGPFKLTSAVHDVGWTFTKNNNYDGHKPAYKKLVLQYETSDSAEFNALKTGSIQVGFLPASMYASRKQLTHDHIMATYGFTFVRNFVNYKSPKVGSLLKQLAVRQAMEYGIDQKGIIRSLYNGNGTYGTNPVPSHPPVFLDPKLKNPLYPFNIKKGIQVLHKAGFHRIGGVMTNAKGQKLQFTMQYPSGGTTTAALVQLMQRDWGKEGIKISLQPVPFATMLQYHHQPTKWELQADIGWVYGGTYPTGGGLFSSTGGFNFYGYKNSTMNKLVTLTQKPYPTKKQSMQALYNYEVFAAKHLPVLFMPQEAGFRVYENTIHGVKKYANNFTGGISPQYWTLS